MALHDVVLTRDQVALLVTSLPVMHPATHPNYWAVVDLVQTICSKVDGSLVPVWMLTDWRNTPYARGGEVLRAAESAPQSLADLVRAPRVLGSTVCEYCARDTRTEYHRFTCPNYGEAERLRDEHEAKRNA